MGDGLGVAAGSRLPEARGIATSSPLGPRDLRYGELVFEGKSTDAQMLSLK